MVRAQTGTQRSQEGGPCLAIGQVLGSRGPQRSFLAGQCRSYPVNSKNITVSCTIDLQRRKKVTLNSRGPTRPNSQAGNPRGTG